MTIQIHDFEPRSGDLLNEAIAGLKQTQKELPCKYFYDAVGAELFEQICNLPEYYPTRTELKIMRDHVAEMADCIGPNARIVEYGSGEGLKTRLLLDALKNPTAYLPIDIARDQLERVAKQLQGHYPEMEILPVCADYTSEFTLPVPLQAYTNTVVYFPGSTIGNFAPAQAVAFLAKIADQVGTSDAAGGLLIGVDLRKDTHVMEAAYNDRAGVTAAFNLNLLHRLNQEVDADFNVDAFTHNARFNRQTGAIEMHLISTRQQSVQLNGDRFSFHPGESIHTENSFKYNLDDFAQLAAKAGWQREHIWLDADELFSVQYFSTTA